MNELIYFDMNMMLGVTLGLMIALSIILGQYASQPRSIA